jgi:hypothetical protein
MKKIPLDTTGITNELTGASLFFAGEQATKLVSKGPKTTPEPASPEKEPSVDATHVEIGAPVLEAKHRADAGHSKNKIASNNDSRHVNERARYPASNQASFIEEIRRAVKDPGGKTTFVRLTAEEKNHLVDLVYTYKRQGNKTSENELVRIAIGFLLEDHTERGQDSVLAQVIEALNA